MNTTTTLRARRAGVRAVVAALATAVAVAGVSAPAQAAEPRPDNGDGTVTITSPLTVERGAEIALEGSGFTAGTTAGAPSWQQLSLKLDDGGDVLKTVQLEADGTFETTLKLADDIALGEHWIRFLGSNPVVSKHTQSFTVVDELPAGADVTAAVTVGGRGNPAGTVTITVAGNGFEAGEQLTATVDGTAKTWGAAPGTASVEAGADGTVSNARLVFTPGTLTAGEHELVIGRSAPGAEDITKKVTVPPTTTFSTLAADSEGVLTLGILPADATITGVSLGDVEFTVPATADAQGNATIAYSIPASAELGTLPLTITQANPAATYTLSAKVSPSATVFGTEAFDRVETPAGLIQQGLYQSAYSAKNDKLFVTSASVLATSTLYKLDPRTLAVEASVVPAEETPGALWAAYGVGVDDANGTVWVSNTRQNTIAVYRQSDLGLVKQFPRDELQHSRDIVVDATRNRVYISSAAEGTSGDGYIGVYDGTTLERITRVQTGPRTDFSPMSLALDEKKGLLYTVSNSSSKAAVVDVASSSYPVRKFEVGLPAYAKASGVDVDPRTQRLFVASQTTDDLIVWDLAKNRQIADVATGAGALNVQVDPVHGLVYIANFGGTTITVLDEQGATVARLPLARTNHLEIDGKGSVFAVNKAADNQVVKLTPKALEAGSAKVKGTARVGGRLTASTAGWTAGTQLSYQWLRAGRAIAGATESTYVPVAADRGKAVSVRVRGARAPYAAATVTSSAVRVGTGVLRSAVPKIAGKPKVGKRLTAKPGSWTAGTRLTYRWYVGGKAAGTGKSLRLQAKHRGKKVTLKVTGAKSGYKTVTRTSKKTAKVKR